MENVEVKKERNFFKRKFTDTWFASAFLAILLLFVGEFLGILIEFIPGIQYPAANQSGRIFWITSTFTSILTQFLWATP